MGNNLKVAISADFLDSFAALPRQIQGKVTEFMNKFRNNPLSAGIHYEKLTACKDKKICSVRIDDTYRGIVVRQEETGTYLLLWVDHHDEAYAWAKNKKCEVNPNTGAIQVYDMKVVENESNANIKSNNQEKLFSKVDDKDLCDLGLPKDMISLVRSISTSNEFYEKKDSFPIDVFENLSWIVEGIPLDEIKESLNTHVEKQKITDDFSEALNSPLTLKSFVVVEGEDELRRIIAEPLEKWRVFLHPTQRKIVNKNFLGSARVLGGAGTGKTVVAMHRAKYLSSMLENNERILFTTYTANLASDIKDNLKKICSKEELKKIDVINLDAWVAQFLRDHGYTSKIIYDDEMSKILNEAALNNGLDDEFSEGFYEEEYNRVIAAQEAFTLEKYIKASRIGRGTRLDRKKRVEIWGVFETYQNIMKEQNVRDINTAMYECKLLISKFAKEMNYKYVIVDESQDLSANAFKLIRAIAGVEHENDIFIVGDSHQRIYKNKAVLSKCGINIRGRSSTLKINYRTTDEIRKVSMALLNGLSFDDLDDNLFTDDKCMSLTHGEFPKVINFNNANQEFDSILQEINNLKQSGVLLKNICVVARTHKLLDDYIRNFISNKIRCYEIKGNKSDDRSIDDLRVATMHRAKGLEFQYVFIVAANKNVIPLKSAINHTDTVSENESIKAEKCLLYVALTRAQKGAYISSYGQKSEFLK